MLKSLTAGFRALFRRETVNQELHDELRHYLDLAVAEKMRDGMTREAAERAARIEMGGIEPTKERVRHGGWEATVETLWQDLHYGVRGLRRAPAFTTIAVTTLALGIGANTAMFSVVNAVMLRPLPYRNAGKLAMIWTDDTRRGLHREKTAYSTITDWRAQSRAFIQIAFFSTERTATIGNDAAIGRQRTRDALVSANLFPVLGTTPLFGRVISTEDEANRALVAVISYSLWQQRFGGAADVLGKPLVADDLSKGGIRTFTVIGVMPPEFYFPDKLTQFWVPATTYWRFTRESGERFESWARRWTSIGRLTDGASIEDARVDLNRIGKQLAVTNPSTITDFPGFGTTVAPMLDFVTGTSLQTSLWVLLAAVGMVLLVACANVANLFLARGATRQREFAVRRALGAGRGRLVRQLVAESLVLAAAGGATGVLLAMWGTRTLAKFAAAYVPRIDEISVDGSVLFFAGAISVAAGVAFSLAPALHASSTDAAGNWPWAPA